MTEEHKSVGEMWEKFLSLEKISKEEIYTSWPFGGNEESANELLELVMRGKKKATASLYDIYEYIDEPLPKVGDFSVITDWKGEAHCIIRTTNVEIIPFNEVPEEFARKEGEGDQSLTYWRDVHRKFFALDLNETAGKEFKEDILVVCEEFEVVFK